MHDDSVSVRANDAPDFIANRHRHVPPAFGPRAHTPRRPNIGVFMQPIVSRSRHRAETVRNQVDRSFENRKFRTPFEKVVGHDVSPLNCRLIYHIHIWSAEMSNFDNPTISARLRLGRMRILTGSVLP